MNDSGPQTAAPGGNGQAPQLGSDPAEMSACWNETGVYGSSTCTRLPEFVHCRHCPLHSQAALLLLNRPLPRDYRQGCTEHFGREKKHPAPGNTSAVLFRISAEWLALPTWAFQEVAERRPVHSLPHRREGIVLGLVNIRGELLVCISLGHLLGLEHLLPYERLRTAHHRLLVVSRNGNRFVFPVDEVQGTQRFHPQELREAPATVAKSRSSFTQGILCCEQRTVGFLNIDVLFSAVNRSLA